MSTPPVVRRATRSDVPRLAATLAMAYPDYRWTSWALPEDGRTQRLSRWAELWGALVPVLAETAWVTDDVAAAAAWVAPDAPPHAADLQAVIDRDLPRVFGARQPVVLASERLGALGRPDEPHWWLHAVGTRPAARHQGLGAAVLQPVLDRCDADGVPAAATVYTSTVVRWLQRSGFAVTHSTRTAVDHELPIWTLVRQPLRA
ncbi:GNAT family N-acetyltransferase [Modestobacter roseus]|uniref:Acetyltransferase (GNAT) family protein n=1 Tax=Modestobacter roseus TaxID=1181884 RepID=A0A562IW49_9ACTN|nr:GNAT family N-acetyltransferase [Modestobacter roseus]MQA36055.1 GNAT family N-acetyltransferase [Modestobacter roseus]TWH75060.1 acetyltransferase (GNAT) family protein [Modestobacter roseus]